MNRKPTSGRDLLMVVQNVSHPGLKLHHQAVLVTLATNGDWNTGTKCRPTHALLQACARNRKGQPSSDTWIGNILGDLIGWGLIERTHRGRGEGNASEYRLCLENPAYPDRYPTYKEPKVIPNCTVGTKKSLSPSETEVSPNKIPSLSQQNSELCPTKGLVPSQSLSESTSTHTPTPTPTPPTATAGVVCVDTKTKPSTMESQRQPPGHIGSPEEEVDNAIKYVSEQEGEPVIPTGPQKRKMIELAKQYPGARFRAAVKAFAKHHPWNSKTDASNRWSYFVNGFPGYDVMKTVADKETQRRADQARRLALTDEFTYLRRPLDDNWRYREFFTADDKEFLEQLEAAKGLHDMPLNAEERGKELMQRVEKQWKEQQDFYAAATQKEYEEARAGLDALGLAEEIPSQHTEALDEVKQS